MLQQLKSSFKRTINWNKYQSEPKTLTQNQYLNHLIDPSFQGVNILFILLFETDPIGTGHTRCFLPSLEIKDCNVMIYGKKLFYQRLKDDTKRYENIRKILTGKRDDLVNLLFTRLSLLQRKL